MIFTKQIVGWRSCRLLNEIYMKPEIENLKVWMSGRSTTGYQRALAMREFEQLLTYVAELEKLRQPLVSDMLKCASCENTAKKDGLDCYGKCHICTQSF